MIFWYILIYFARPIFLTPKFRPPGLWNCWSTCGKGCPKEASDCCTQTIICVCTVRYCISVYLCISVYQYTFQYLYLHTSLSLSLSRYMYIYINKCKYMYLCMYIPISTNSYKHVFPQSLLVPSCSARHRHLSCRQVSVKCHNWRPVWFWTFMSHFPWKPGSTGSWVSWVLLSDDGVLPDL